ncbi:MAG: M20 family metallopeptidase [Ferrimicrobium sp.]
MDLSQERDLIRATADHNWDRAYDLSHRIHSHPELGFEEYLASEWLSTELEQVGFNVERGVGSLPTAFEAVAGSGSLNVVICAEYDALPGVGHACGHNVIAAAALLAGAALKPLVDELDLTLRVIGTPAEEGGGGKVLLLEAGVFTGANLAMMVHPGPSEADRMGVIAATHLEVSYVGKEAHASAFPQLGINALDAMTIAQTSIGLLRQHLYSWDRIHGIITHGGDAPNVIPADVRGHFIIRSRTLQELEDLRPKVNRCFEAGAIATGSTVSITQPAPAYSEFITDEAIAEIYRQEAVTVGRVFAENGHGLEASTDMANISLEVPSIHPIISIDSWPAVNHQPEFTAAAASAAADRAVFEGGIAMALTILSTATNDSLRARLRSHSCR